MPSTDLGYIPMTAGERFDEFKDLVESAAADLGLSAPAWSRKEFLTFVGRIVAQQLAEVDQIPATREDALDPNQLFGSQLRRLAELRGTPVNGATPSTVECNVYAWDVADVSLFADATQATYAGKTWTLNEDVVIPAGGTVVATFVCEEEGAVELASGVEMSIVTSTPGWTAIVTHAVADVGDEGDTDSQIRERLFSGFGSRGSRSPLALQATLEGLDEVEKARVEYNRSAASASVSGKTIPANGVGVWVYPDSISDAAKLNVLRVLFGRLSHDTARSLPVTTGADGFVGVVVSPTSGQSFTEGAWYMSESSIHVVIGVSDSAGYAAGFTPGSLDEALKGAVEAYFQGLDAGSAVYQQELLAKLVSLEGIVRLDYLRIKEGSTPGVSDTADIPVDPASFATCDTTSNLTIVHEP